MVKKQEYKSRCNPKDSNMGCCKIESVVTIDDRGQMVLPKEIRDKAQIRAGDKIAVICLEKDGKVCCISLLKVDDLTDMVKSKLGPIMKDIL